MEKKYRLTMAYLISLCIVAGCGEENGSKDCDPVCGENETCVNGTCEPNTSGDTNVCDPVCGENETCVDGTCEPNTSGDTNVCDPACGENETCVDGTCEPNTSGDTNICDPACGENETCVDGTCEPNGDPNACKPNSCNGSDYFCGESGTWELCKVGSGCHMGICIEGLGRACDAGTCSEDGKSECKDGQWKACGSLDTCVEGQCVVSDEACEPYTCSPDNAYRCTEAGRYEKCGDGLTCSPEQGGVCVDLRDRLAAMLWVLCRTASDCSNGECIHSVVTSKPLTSYKLGLINADSIPVSKLDSRIPEGYGICSKDCTKEASACNAISSSVPFTCHVAAIGESPYPPRNEEGASLSLPFYQNLDKTWMSEGVAFAALCQPADVTNQAYENTFCARCESQSDCASTELCVANSCLPRCSSNSVCPLGYSCESSKLDGSLDEDKVCVPPGQTCGACADADGDGQGYGHCTDKRYDCAPLDSHTSYRPETLPTTCSHEHTDTNCNGKIDFFEMLGSAEHCRFCNDSCSNDSASVVNTAMGCQMNPDTQMYKDEDLAYSQIDDTYYAERFDANNSSTYLTTCQVVCAEGYGDCDGDPSNGCEAKLIDYTREDIVIGTGAAAFTKNIVTSVTPLVQPVIKDSNGRDTSGITYIYEYDEDSDGYAANDPEKQIYCCSQIYDRDALNTQCYAFPNTRFNSNGAWDKPNTEAFDTDEKWYQETGAVFGDCDDNDPARHPRETEKDVCDGIDNDCDSTTPDGYSSIYELNQKQYQLGDSCDVYGGGGTICDPDGIIKCDPGNQKLICAPKSESNQATDTNCNGIDEDCDGVIDDDYPVTIISDGVNNVDESINICGHKVKVCQDGKEVVRALYQPRERDFYGDGIDSNCDLYDYDLKNAVFVNNYNREGEYNGNDAHDGTSKSPYASLQKALTKACGGTAYTAAENIARCHDIIISTTVNSDGDEENPWGKSEIKIPVFSADAIHTELSKNKPLLDAHVPQKKITNSLNELVCAVTGSGCVDQKSEERCLVDGCAQDYPFPNEIYPPKERVRIYGGGYMNILTGEWTITENISSYSYTLPNQFDSNGVRFISLISQADGLASRLNYQGDDIIQTNAGSLSVKFENMQFRFIGTESKIPDGMTMVGLTCGPRGCEDLTFVNTTITVTGGTGANGNTFSYIPNNSFVNVIPENCKYYPELTSCGILESSKNQNGIDARSEFYPNYNVNQFPSSSLNAFLLTYEQNRLYPKFYNIKENKIDWTIPDENIHLICPDGATPLGGTPGARINGITNSNNTFFVPTNIVHGLDGHQGGSNVPGGKGTKKKLYSIDYDLNYQKYYDMYECEADQTDLAQNKELPKFEELCAGNGSHGGGGIGGSFFKPNGEFKNDKNPLYTRMTKYGLIVESDRSLGAGSVGQSGGGGGASASQFATEENWKDRYGLWLHGASGGIGGCAGRGGLAGGTGTSVIGLHMTPPSDEYARFNLKVEENKNLLNLTSGAGGAGQPGQPGLYGGWRGKGIKKSDVWGDVVIGGGGVGGSGGGGGGGAGGLAGNAYAFVFICNRDIKIDTPEDLIKCSYNTEEGTYLRHVLNYPSSYATVNAPKHGGDGGNGAAGLPTKDKSKAGQAVDRETTDVGEGLPAHNGGAAGSAGTSSVSGGERYIYHVVDTGFRH